VRNVRAVNCSSPTHLSRLSVLASYNMQYSSKQDTCTSGPCLNGGVCLVINDYSYKCDCAYTHYEGKLCDKPRPPRSSSELTFTGKDYFSFEVPGSTAAAASVSYEEEFYLEFKTSRSIGLLAYAGDVHDYIVIGLQDGGLFYKVNLKKPGQVQHHDHSGTYLHNNHWHSVKFTRKKQQVNLIQLYCVSFKTSYTVQENKR